MSIRYGSVTATAAALGALAIPRVASATQNLAARGESLAAFDERCIPKPPQRGCRVGGPGASGVAPPSKLPVLHPTVHNPHGGDPACAVVAPCRRGGVPTRLPRWGPRGASLVSVRRQTFT